MGFWDWFSNHSLKLKQKTMKLDKKQRRNKIAKKIRKKVNGSNSIPRISVFRSNKAIYCQAIDDVNGLTIVHANSNDDAVDKEKTKTEQAKMVGELLAKKMLEKNIDRAVFDRRGYLYHGRVKALADGAREAGLKF